MTHRVVGLPSIFKNGVHSANCVATLEENGVTVLPGHLIYRGFCVRFNKKNRTLISIRRSSVLRCVSIMTHEARRSVRRLRRDCGVFLHEGIRRQE